MVMIMMIVSDHGMGATADERVIRIDRMIPPEIGTIVTEGPLSGVKALPAGQSEAAAALGLGWGASMRLVLLP